MPLAGAPDAPGTHPRTSPRPALRQTTRQRACADAIPDGSRRAPSQAAWIRAVEAHPAFAQFRVDAHANLMAVAWVLARSADWTALTTRPTWSHVSRLAGIRRSTVAKYLRLLREEGLLGVVETGSTPLIRTGVLYGLVPAGAGNRAAEYVLCVLRPSVTDMSLRPDVDETRTPSGFHQEARYTPPRAPENAPISEDGWTLAVTPRTRGEMLAAAKDLQCRCPMLARVTSRHLRSILRIWWMAGWTPADVLHCLDHKPSGELWPHTDAVRSVPGWIRYRLGVWLGPDGKPLPSPSQLRHAEHERQRAEQVHRDAEWTALRAAAVSPSAHVAHASAARALLRAHSPAAARVIDLRAAGITAPPAPPPEGVTYDRRIPLTARTGTAPSRPGERSLPQPRARTPVPRH